MKMLSLSRLVFAVGLVSGCSAASSDVSGSGLRGLLEASGGNPSFSTGGAAVGGTGGGKTGGATGVSTGGKTNGFGSGGTSFGSGGKGSGGVSFGSGGVTGFGGALATGGSSTGGVSNAQGGSLGSGGAASGGTSSGGTSSGGAGTGGKATGGAATGGAATGGAATGGAATGGAATGGTGGGASSGLIGYWKFDEASGTTAADSSITNNNTLTLGGTAGCATLGTAGKLGKRLTLGKGTPLANSCSGVASKAAVDLGSLTKVTVALWMKKETGDPSFSYTAGLLEFDSIFSLSWDFDSLSWFAGDGEALFTAPTDEVWHHVAGTWNTSTGELHLFLDGSEVAAGANATTGGSGSHKLSVGKVTTGTTGFAGGIDDVRIYNRILSDAEIAALAQ